MASLRERVAKIRAKRRDDDALSGMESLQLAGQRKSLQDIRMRALDDEPLTEEETLRKQYEYMVTPSGEVALPPGPDPNAMESVAFGAQSVSGDLGLGDEAAALGSSGLSVEGARDFLDDPRNQQAARSGHPVFYRAGQALGILPQMWPGAVAGAGHRLGTSMLAGGATGAGLAAGETFAEGEGGANRRLAELLSEQGGINTAIGVGAGIAAPLVGQLVDAGVGAATGGLAKGATQRAVGDPHAARVLARSAEYDLDPGSPRRFSELGPEAVIADIGPNLRANAYDMATMAGPQKRAFQDTLMQRTANRRARVEADVNRTMGGSTNIPQTRQALEDYRNQRGQPGLHQKMRRLWQQLKYPGEYDPATWNDAVSVRGRYLDLFTRAVRDKANTLGRAGDMDEARNLRALNNRIIDAVPGLRDARLRYAQDSDLLDRIDSGSGILNRQMSIDQFADEFSRMSPTEQQVARLAARDEVQTFIDAAPETATKGRVGVFDSPIVKEKARILFGDEAVEAIENRAFSEKVFLDTNTRVIGGSQTDPRAASAEATADITGRAVERQRVGGIGRAARALSGLKDPVRERSAQRISEALLSEGPQADRILRAMLEDVNRRGRGKARGQAMNEIATWLASAAPAARER
jgi:hypothetical protein